jgi:uncharacterized protein (DUF924 family)
MWRTYSISLYNLWNVFINIENYIIFHYYDCLMQILSFWFPNNDYNLWWFKSNQILDRQIYDTYYEQMIQTFNDFNIENYIDKSPEELITTIILLDQFSRNINRIINLNVKEYTEKAYLLSQLWIDKQYYLIQPINWTVFALLPMRHIGKQNDLINIISILNQIENVNSKNEIFIKFKLHTIKQHNILI